jgi:hypothetical protein
MPTEQARIEFITAALGALPKDAETLRIQWRGSTARLPIIRLQTDLVLLNPDSHRIKSQLESDEDALHKIQEDPNSDEAQEAIASLLRATPGFDALKSDLSDKGQIEPGIVTTTGLLVNANTRAVALRDLGVEYIEAAVLPTDATIGEIYALELSLQVAQDFKQDYTFTNELLFVEDLITKENKSERDVAISLGWASVSKKGSVDKAVEKVRRYVRHLDLIRDIQNMSDGKIPLTFFDDQIQALQELDQAYEGLRNKNPVDAERLKKARILGLLVDLGYDRQRQVDAGWVTTYLLDAIEENPVLSELLSDGLVGEAGRQSTSALGEQFAELEDLGNGPGGSNSAEEDGLFAFVETLVDVLGKGAKSETVKLETKAGEKSYPKNQLSAAVQDAMRLAADDAKDALKAGDKLLVPQQQIAQASKSLKKAREAYEGVRGQAGFQPDGVSAAFKQLERAVDALRIAMES